jgi:flagellin-like protein
MEKNHMSWSHPIKRRGVTGIETVIMFVALIISAVVFSIVVLTTGIIVPERTAEVVPSAMEMD